MLAKVEGSPIGPFGVFLSVRKTLSTVEIFEVFDPIFEVFTEE